MQRKSLDTVCRALLPFIVVAVLTGGKGTTVSRGLETEVQGVRAGVFRTLGLYRERVYDFKNHIAHKIKTKNRGVITEGEVDQGKIEVFRLQEEGRSGPAPVRLPVVDFSLERPPPESPLVKKRALVRPSPPPSYTVKDRVLGKKLPVREKPEAPQASLKESVSLPSVKPFVWAHGSRKLPRVALSFDSGEMSAGRIGCSRLIDNLEKFKVPATFFFTGRFAESYPDLVRKVGSIPYFELGNHSHSHPDLTKKPAEAVEKEILRTQKAIRKITGQSGRLFRPPYGNTNRTVNDLAAKNGMHIVLWDVEADDYKKHVTGPQVAKSVLRQVRNGSIVLLHMHGDGSASCDALPDIIEGLRDRGFELVKVSALIDETLTE